VKLVDFQIIVFLIEDRVIICYGFGIGSPAAVAAMEELIAAGVKRIVSFGTAGAITPNLKLGDIGVCSKALSDEGTSCHYELNSGFTYPEEKLTNMLFELLNGKIDNTYNVCTWTTDAPFQESVQSLKRNINLGIDTVEMEASALFTLGKFRNVEVASVFVIGDLLTENGWNPGFLKRKVQGNCRKLVITIIEYCLTFNRSNV
jgi:uridine phosphorylase